MNDSLIKKTNEINTDSIFKNHPNVLYAYSDSIIIKPYVNHKHTYKIKASDTLSLQENNEWQKWMPKGKTIIKHEQQNYSNKSCEYDNEFKALALIFILFIWIIRVLK